MFISLVVPGPSRCVREIARRIGVTSDQRQDDVSGPCRAIGEAVPDSKSTAWFGVFAPAVSSGRNHQKASIR